MKKQSILWERSSAMKTEWYLEGRPEGLIMVEVVQITFFPFVRNVLMWHMKEGYGSCLRLGRLISEGLLASGNSSLDVSLTNIWKSIGVNLWICKYFISVFGWPLNINFPKIWSLILYYLIPNFIFVSCNIFFTLVSSQN